MPFVSSLAIDRKENDSDEKSRMNDREEAKKRASVGYSTNEPHRSHH